MKSFAIAAIPLIALAVLLGCTAPPQNNTAQSNNSANELASCVTTLSDNNALDNNYFHAQKRDSCVGMAIDHPDLCAYIPADYNIPMYGPNLEPSVEQVVTTVQDRDWCYYEAAVQGNLNGKHNDPNLCEKISTQAKMDICYSSVASVMGDAAFCDKIVDANSRDYCNAAHAS